MECGCDLGNAYTPCPKCGSMRRSVTAIAAPLGATIFTFIAWEKRYNANRRKKNKPFSSGANGVVRDASGRLVKKTRHVDYEKDRYFEHVEDADTGEVIRHCDEPLTEHRDRGSAKKK
jgi:hypothetical protein